MKDLRQETKEQEVALLVIRTLRANKASADLITAQQLQTIFFQLHSHDMLPLNPSSTVTPVSSVPHSNTETLSHTASAAHPRRTGSANSLSHSLALLSQLQTNRHPRTAVMYHHIMRHCITEGRIDMAAAVFVGLVEEWILEGRLAEGGEVGDFGEGGIPSTEKSDMLGTKAGKDGRGDNQRAEERNRAREPDVIKAEHDSQPHLRPEEQEQWLKQKKAIIDGWFEGVRTWRLFGETLAPLEKLKLWHPKALRLQEKMRSFPLPSPTSPPSLVPAPDKAMLSLITKQIISKPDVTGAYLDKKTGSRILPVTASRNRSYRRSTRALAILSNTILSRTLPITALSPLLSAMREQSLAVPVYPKKLDTRRIPSHQLKEYTAGAHIHSALISLLWAPPSHSTSGTWGAYRLQPLSYSAVKLLVRYATSVLSSMKVLLPFLNYAKSVIGVGAIAKAVSFPARTAGSGFFSRYAVPFAGVGDSAIREKRTEQPKTVSDADRQANTAEGVGARDELDDDTRIYHLKSAAAQGRKPEIVDMVRRAFPILWPARSSLLPIAGDVEATEAAQAAADKTDWTARMRESTSQSVWLYLAALEALVSIRRHAMAERVYQLALQAEVNSHANSTVVGREEAVDQLVGWFLPIEAHNYALEMCNQQHLAHSDENTQSLSAAPNRGFYLPNGARMPHTIRAKLITQDRVAWHTAEAILSIILRAHSRQKYTHGESQKYQRSVAAYDTSVLLPARPNNETVRIAFEITSREAQKFMALTPEERRWKFGFHVWRRLRKLQSVIGRFGLRQNKEITKVQREMQHCWISDKEHITKGRKSGANS